MRLIDADALWDEVRELADYAKKHKLLAVYDGLFMAISAIDRAYTIDAEPVKHGHWTDDDNCSMCGFRVTQKTRHYCPNCGAKMDAADTDAPTIEAEPVRHGHWIHTGVTNVFGGHQHKCSVCGYSLMVSKACDNENYCSCCGAKMNEVSG